MYKRFFGFKERPFKLVPNPEYLYLSKTHEEALAHLTYAVSQGDGFVQITGEVGTGKTTLCRVFLNNLDENVHAAYIFNPKLDATQLLKAVNDEFGIDSTPDTNKELIDILNRYLMEQKAAGRKVLLLVDEAQNLSSEVLEQLRLLSNLETTQDKLLQIILVGQPELGKMLVSHELRQLGQRINISTRLVPLSAGETREYIAHRINLASRKPTSLFDDAACRVLFRFSKGVPRLINISCDRALLIAFGQDTSRITSRIAKQAVLELGGHGESRDFFSLALGARSVVLLLIVGALIIGLYAIPFLAGMLDKTESIALSKMDMTTEPPDPPQSIPHDVPQTLTDEMPPGASSLAEMSTTADYSVEQSGGQQPPEGGLEESGTDQLFSDRETPIALVESNPVPENDEGLLPSTYPKDEGRILSLLERWRQAWQSKDMDAYIALYDDSFLHGNKNISEWREFKDRLNRKYEFIKVEIADVKISWTEDGAIVTFVQTYQSDAYHAAGLKSLQLQFSNNQWRIIREVWSGSLLKT